VCGKISRSYRRIKKIDFRNFQKQQGICVQGLIDAQKNAHIANLFKRHPGTE